jgi:hypothetical protein
VFFVAITTMTNSSGLLIHQAGALSTWSVAPLVPLSNLVLRIMIDSARSNEVDDRLSFSNGEWFGTNVTGPVIHFDDMTKYNSMLEVFGPLGDHCQHLVWAQTVVPLSLNKALCAFVNPIVNAEFHHLKRCATDIELVFLTMLDESVMEALAVHPDHTPPAELRRPEPLLATIFADGSLEISRGMARTAFDLPVVSTFTELPMRYGHGATDDDDSDDDGDAFMGIEINRTEFPHGGSITEIDIPESMESFSVRGILAAARQALHETRSRTS